MNINENKEIENANQDVWNYIDKNGTNLLLPSLGETYSLCCQDCDTKEEAYRETVDTCRLRHGLSMTDALRVTHYTLKKLEMI